MCDVPANTRAPYSRPYGHLRSLYNRRLSRPLSQPPTTHFYTSFVTAVAGKFSGFALGAFPPLAGMKAQEIIIKILNPTPTPRAPPTPMATIIARPTKAPRKRAPAAANLWSRVITLCRISKSLGSVTNSTQTVVSTTTKVFNIIRNRNRNRRSELTRRSELGVQPLSHDSL